MLITDPDGDTIELRPAEFREDCLGGTFIEVIQNYEDGDESARVSLTRDQAFQAAQALVENAGGSVVPAEALKRASDLSFNEAVMRVACAHKRTVTFRYAKDKGQYIEARRFNPESISEDGSAAIGHDPDRDDAVRRFRFDRIKGEVSFA